MLLVWLGTCICVSRHLNKVLKMTYVPTTLTKNIVQILPKAAVFDREGRKK